jgi:hypothetical protein
VAGFNKFQPFVADIANKVHNLGSDSLKIMLTNTSPNTADTAFDTSVGLKLISTSNALDLTTSGGYTAGGAAVTITASTQSAGVYKLVGNDLVFTATTGFGPFRYAVLYNNTAGTAAARPLIGWWDYGSAVTLLALETFTVDLDQANGILTIT